MTMNDNDGHEQGSGEDEFRELIDLVDEVVDDVTDDDINDRLRAVLGGAGFLPMLDEVPDARLGRVDGLGAEMMLGLLIADADDRRERAEAQLARLETSAAEARRHADAELQRLRTLSTMADEAEIRAATACEREKAAAAGVDAYVDVALERALEIIDKAKTDAAQIVADARRQAADITAEAETLAVSRSEVPAVDLVAGTGGLFIGVADLLATGDWRRGPGDGETTQPGSIPALDLQPCHQRLHGRMDRVTLAQGGGQSMSALELKLLLLLVKADPQLVAHDLGKATELLQQRLAGIETDGREAFPIKRNTGRRHEAARMLREAHCRGDEAGLMDWVWCHTWIDRLLFRPETDRHTLALPASVPLGGPPPASESDVEPRHTPANEQVAVSD